MLVGGKNDSFLEDLCTEIDNCTFCHQGFFIFQYSWGQIIDKVFQIKTTNLVKIKLQKQIFPIFLFKKTLGYKNLVPRTTHICH
jgi:hypothetical protein